MDRVKLKRIIKKIFNTLGYEVARVPRPNGTYFSEVKLKNGEILDLDQLANKHAFIDGMISRESGKMLYSLCYMQSVRGDVVEVGSWQGYSTSYLAKATVDSKNGSFWAIDHFKGNVGKEHYYVVGKKDLSDLRGNFEKNMRRAGLLGSVNLLDMKNNLAAKKLKGKKVRFLFIDADHSKKGVEKDIELFFPLLVSGSMVVFDDFSNYAPGLVEAIDELFKTQKFKRSFCYRKMLILVV